MACDVLHVAMFFFSVQQISLKSPFFQTVLTFLSQSCIVALLVIVTVSIVRPPLLLNPHPIVAHAALLLGKRGSYNTFGESQLVLLLTQSWESEFKLDQSKKLNKKHHKSQV